MNVYFFIHLAWVIKSHPIFDIISPRQCLAGQYCAGSAGSSYGTGPCPKGFSCGPGSVRPDVAPIGRFVGSAGSVLSYDCSAGTFSPYPGLAYCLACPPGYSCADPGTIVPKLCAPGTFRTNAGQSSLSSSLNSVSCVACGEGTYAPFRGTPQDINCEPCPAGRICLAQTANITSTNPCSEGYVCGEATTLSSSTLHVCPAGFYCPSETTAASVYSHLCPVGFVCQSGTGLANRFLFRCRRGFYCPSGSAWTDQMNTPLQSPDAYLSRGQFHVIQTAATYCLRRIMAIALDEIQAENERNLAAGIPNITLDQQNIRLSAWTSDISDCVLLQMPYVALVAANARPVSSFVTLNSEWHSNHILKSSAFNVPASQFSNKCIPDQFPRVGEETTWDCLCTANIAEPGSFMSCLSTKKEGVSNIGAPFTYSSSYGIDDPRNCETNWPACIDWAQLGNYKSGDTVSKETGPSTGAAVDDFDALAVALIDYIASAIYYDAVYFASISLFAPNSCPYGTLSASTGLTSSSECTKRILDTSLGDPDDIVVLRVNPINIDLTNVTPQLGIPTLWEEDQRMTVAVPANGFATVTIDTRDLPSDMQYGRDWRFMFFVNGTLDPDANDPAICNQIWTDFLNLQASGTAPFTYSAWQRDLNLTQHGCTWVRNPIGFDAFEFETGSICPAAGGGLCYFTASSTPCNVLGVPLEVQELYVHALQDVMVRVEVQILNGYYAPDRFKFINAVSIDVQQAQRAFVGTNNAFVIETNSAIAALVHYPFNLPVIANTSELLTQAFVSWLPRTESVQLTNCMRHTSAWEEFFYTTNSFYASSYSSVFSTYIPYFSNCRGFGTVTPLWFLLEKHPNCVQVSPKDTVAIGLLSFGVQSVGDACDYVAYNSNAAPIQLACMVDEIPNNKQPVSRWFESPTGTELFLISSSSMSAGEIAKLDRSQHLSSAVPVVLKNGATSDGTSPLTVQFKLRYWQKSSVEKIITLAEVYFANFTQLTDAQSKGNDAWNYTLQVTWSPMNYIEVFNAYAFPVYAYLLYAIVVGIFCVSIALGHWAYHWLMARTRFVSASLWDSRYYTYLVPPLIKGVSLAMIPVSVSFMIMMIVFHAGNSTWFLTPFYACTSAQAMSELGCQYTFLDTFPSSWSGESPSSPYTYSERREARAGITLMVLAVYVIMSTVRAFIPRLESRFYDSKEEKEEERNWPPDQKTFAPLAFKRTTWFAMLTGSCLVCTLVVEFSFSTAFFSLWWLYAVLVIIVAKIYGSAAEYLLVEEVLKIPIMALFETVMHLVTLGAPDLFAFILTMFITQAALILDRMYIVPFERVIGKRLVKKIRIYYWRFRTIIGRNGNQEQKGFTEDMDEPRSGARSHQSQADRSKNDSMMYFMSSFTASAIATILTPITVVVLTSLYTATQMLNYYNISTSQATYYFGFQFAILGFRFLADVVALNTAENYHQWKILDYLEYCRYRFAARPTRWKGVGELADELVTPELRSLDMMCFSSQFYFAIFLESAGLVFFFIGLQVVVNNAWNVFDDQATMIIIGMGVAILGFCKYGIVIWADYLKLWYLEDSSSSLLSQSGEETNSRQDNASVQEATNIGALFAGHNVNERIIAPVGSVLHDWPEPSSGDAAGWQRYRIAFLKENQLWLRAHMDTLIEGPTTVEYRKLLLESLAKILRESNILDLTAKGSAALEFSALPPHSSAVRAVVEAKTLTQGTVTELAARTWLTRARFLRFLRETVRDIPLLSKGGKLKKRCECCREPSDKAPLKLVPEYPVAYVADQLRIQREFYQSWNMPVWQHFFSTFTPGVSLCDSCEKRFGYTFKPVPVREMRLALLQSEPKPCRKVLKDSPFGVPRQPLSDAAAHLLRQWHTWASDLLNPEAAIEDILEEPRAAVPPGVQRLAKFWLETARTNLINS